MNIENNEYETFYNKLTDIVLRKEFNNKDRDDARASSSLQIWVQLSSDKFKEIFGNSSKDYIIFYRKRGEARKGKFRHITLPDDLIIKALRYMDIDLSPEWSSNNELTPKEQAQLLYSKFKEEFIKINTNKTHTQQIIWKNINAEKKKRNFFFYRPIFENSDWRLFLHSRNSDENDSIWILSKLLLRFENAIDEDIPVTIKNVDSYDYAGEINLAESQEEIIVINLVSVTYQSRPVNIKVNVGKGNGDILLGQYLTHESDGYIISGNIVLQKIHRYNELIELPENFSISKQEKYIKDSNGVNKSILQYLHNKKQNFHRTLLKGSHSLDSFEKWVEENKSQSTD